MNKQTDVLKHRFSNVSHTRCPKIKGKCVIVCIEVSHMASNINDIFLTWKNSLEGQMVEPRHTWTVKFQVETVPRVATLHLAYYRAACVVSRPQPLLMASTWLSLAQTNVQWQQHLPRTTTDYKCGIEQKWWLIIEIYFIIGSDFHCLICVYIMCFVPDVRQGFVRFDITYIFFLF